VRVHFARVDRLRLIVKRQVDLTGALLGVLFFSPVMVIIGLLVRLDSHGPVLFGELRRGYQGRLFAMLRFRTTVGDGEEQPGGEEPGKPAAGGRLGRAHNSPRVTQFGRFLRRYRLDELPQLVNVLRGEMSLVGPRPISVADSDRLREHDQQGYERRLTVVPGVTGTWQVARQADWNHTQMIQLDVDYVENWSLARDLGIICKTMLALLRRRPD